MEFNNEPPGMEAVRSLAGRLGVPEERAAWLLAHPDENAAELRARPAAAPVRPVQPFRPARPPAVAPQCECASCEARREEQAAAAAAARPRAGSGGSAPRTAPEALVQVARWRDGWDGDPDDPLGGGLEAMDETRRTHLLSGAEAEEQLRAKPPPGPGPGEHQHPASDFRLPKRRPRPNTTEGR